MKTYRDTITIRTLQVWGEIWTGRTTQSDYVLTIYQYPETLEEAAKIAVDFSHVARANIRTETRVIDGKIENRRLCPDTGENPENETAETTQSFFEVAKGILSP